MKHLQRKQNWRTALYSHTEAYEKILNWKKKPKDNTIWPLHTQAVQIRQEVFFFFLCRNPTQITFLLQLSNCIKDNNFQKINREFLFWCQPIALYKQCSVCYSSSICVFLTFFSPRFIFVFILITKAVTEYSWHIVNIYNSLQYDKLLSLQKHKCIFLYPCHSRMISSIRKPNTKNNHNIGNYDKKNRQDQSKTVSETKKYINKK